MSRLFGAALSVVLLVSACEIERTPPEYFDHRDPIAVERQAAAEELQDRLLALGQALNRGNVTEAMIALAPAPDAAILTPVDGAVLSGADQISAALERFAGTPVAVQMEDVRVEVGPRANVAWFSALMDAPGRGAGGTRIRITGVYVRFEGAWQLVQAHLSIPTSLPYPPQPSPAAAADSLAAE